MVVQNIDRKKEYNIDNPAPYRYAILLDEEWRPCPVKLGNVASSRYKEELNKGQQCPFDMSDVAERCGDW